MPRWAWRYRRTWSRWRDRSGRPRSCDSFRPIEAPRPRGWKERRLRKGRARRSVCRVTGRVPVRQHQEEPRDARRRRERRHRRQDRPGQARQGVGPRRNPRHRARDGPRRSPPRQGV